MDSTPQLCIPYEFHVILGDEAFGISGNFALLKKRAFNYHLDRAGKYMSNAHSAVQRQMDKFLSKFFDEYYEGVFHSL
jgi:hypothetical protein